MPSDSFNITVANRPMDVNASFRQGSVAREPLVSSRTPGSGTTTEATSVPAGSEFRANGSDEANQLDKAIDSVREFVQRAASSLEFSVDDDTGRSVVKVVDTETKEILRQIPSKEMIELAKALDTVQGLLIKQKA